MEYNLPYPENSKILTKLTTFKSKQQPKTTQSTSSNIHYIEHRYKWKLETMEQSSISKEKQETYISEAMDSLYEYKRKLKEKK